MFVTYRKLTNEVVGISEKPFAEDDALATIEVTLTPEEEKKVDAGYILKVENNKVIFIKSATLQDKEKSDKIAEEYTKDFIALQQAKTVEDLKPIIMRLAQNNYNQ